MKLERISDNQIRCMLTAGDLEKRSLKLSELAYGSEKARGLFHELVEQASDELGFDTGGYPLIIEAVPVTSDCIMLLITKANEPEELDTRFARFTESNDGTQDDVPDTESAGADDDLTDIFRQLSDEITQKPKDDDIPGQRAALPESCDDSDADEQQSDDAHDNTRTRIYEFDDLDTVCSFCSVLPADTACMSTLYKNPVTEHFYMILTEESGCPDDFSTACSMASEYGSLHKMCRNNLYYFNEHYVLIVRNDAIKILHEL